MNPEQQQAILTIALLAAFADGSNDDREREQIRQLAESLSGDAGTAELPKIYQSVILKRVSMREACARLAKPEHRQLAYEMAACVCDSDGRMTAIEKQFLAELAQSLKLDDKVTIPADQIAETMAELADTATLPVSTSVAGAISGAQPSTAPMPPISTPRSAVSEAELDRSILNYAILNGALELLPHSWSSMAIIPLQIKMVYGIGKTNGYELDQGHIRELLSTLGVGLTSQYLEQFGRKLLGGLFGKVAGGLGRQLGQSATGVAFSFATTYALGQVAKRYYAGGRQMSVTLLQDTFRNLLGPAKEMQTRYLPQIQQRAGNLDASQIMTLIRGGQA